MVRGSSGFSPMGSQMDVGVVVLVSSPATILAVVTIQLERDSFAIRIWVEEDLSKESSSSSSLSLPPPPAVVTRVSQGVAGG